MGRVYDKTTRVMIFWENLVCEEILVSGLTAEYYLVCWPGGERDTHFFPFFLTLRETDRGFPIRYKPSLAVPLFS